MLDKAIRDLDRERMGLQNQEKKLVTEIKKAAKQGQMVPLPPRLGRAASSARNARECCMRSRAGGSGLYCRQWRWQAWG
jgi:hypothetical protein